MAQAGGVAAGGGAGGGAGEEDVLDVRFLYAPKAKMDVQNRSKSWVRGNQNSPIKEVISLDDKEKFFIKVLRTYNVPNAELNIVYQASDELRRQPADIVEHIDHACMLSQALGRKRRHLLFLMIMLESVAKGSRSSKVEVPSKYRESAQLKGDMKKLEEGIEILLYAAVRRKVCSSCTINFTRAFDMGNIIQSWNKLLQPKQLDDVDEHFSARYHRAKDKNVSSKQTAQ